VPDAPDLAALVAGVPHDNGCASVYRPTIQAGLTTWGPEPRPCDCTRDARIAKGIAAGRRSDELWDQDCERTRTPDGWRDRDAAFARAFEEASRG